MRTRIALLTVTIAGLLLAVQALSAQQAAPAQQTGPYWAYGFLMPPAPGEAAAECGDPRPVSCARPRAAAALDETPHSLPGATRQLSPKQITEWYAPADWYPGDHPQMPEIVAHGNEKTGVRACGLCHNPNGKGRSENAGVAGQSVEYFIQTMAEFKNGTRKSADPRKLNTKEMIAMAKAMTDEETRTAAEYFGSMKWTPWIKVVETDTPPKFLATLGGMFVPAEGGGTQPLGQRIIEMPVNPEETELLRNPRSGWIAYAPVGSIAKGATLVTTGAATGADGKPIPGRTTQCAICHGEDLRGLGNVPGLAGRSPSYLVRQLFDMQQGTRKSALMDRVVAKLTDDDFVAIGAYVASREP